MDSPLDDAGEFFVEGAAGLKRRRLGAQSWRGPTSGLESDPWAQGVLESLKLSGMLKCFGEALPLRMSTDYSGLGSAEEAVRQLIAAWQDEQAEAEAARKRQAQEDAESEATKKRKAQEEAEEEAAKKRKAQEEVEQEAAKKRKAEEEAEAEAAKKRKAEEAQAAAAEKERKEAQKKKKSEPKAAAKEAASAKRASR